RTGSRAAARLPLRHLLDRRRALRGLHGHDPVRGRDAAGRRAQAHPGGASVASDPEPADRSAHLADHPEVHAEGPEGPLPDGQRPLRGADPRDGAGGVIVRRALAVAGGVLLAGCAFAQETPPLSPTPTPSTEPQYFEEPEEHSKFSYRWDFLARYDNV